MATKESEVAVGDIVPVGGAQFEETLASAGPDVLRAMVREFARRMMDADVEVRCNARYAGVTYPGGSATVLFLRPPGQPITWSYSSATLEQGLGATFYTLTGLPHGAVVEAQAEYIEVQDRSRSCQATV